MSNNFYRNIPKMDKILENEIILSLIQEYGKNITKKFIEYEISEIKEKIKTNNFNINNSNEVLELIISNVKKKIIKFFKPKLRKVINATGIVLHTNFGRAPLSNEILKNVTEIAGNYSNLEFDLTTGKRGIRYQNLIEYFKILTGCEDVLVVNNNAAAVLLCLSALAKDKEVIVSRGELIEIGGSFRIPEVMEQSGAILKEVGATNKTHLKDYENAINENTALILKAHTSNYRIIGFTQSVDINELISLGKKYNIPVIFDLGSGSIIDLKQYGLPDEPSVIDIMKTGVDLVTFSGDKLLGGPQAGIILGKKELITKLKKHPLNRALRIDKFTLSALEATIKEYLKNTHLKNITSLNLISLSTKELTKRAKKLIKLLKNIKKFKFSIKNDFSFVGGGAFPMNKIETIVISIESSYFSPSKIDEKLRENEPPIIGRIKDEKFLMDIRTIFPEQFQEIANAFIKLDKQS